jgi:hypothetical protein
VDLQPRVGVGSGGGGPSREEMVAAVARDIRGRVPAPFDVALVDKAIGTPSPTQVGGRGTRLRLAVVARCLLQSPD